MYLPLNVKDRLLKIHYKIVFGHDVFCPPLLEKFENSHMEVKPGIVRYVWNQ